MKKQNKTKNKHCLAVFTRLLDSLVVSIVKTLMAKLYLDSMFLFKTVKDQYNVCVYWLLWLKPAKILSPHL